MGGNFIWLTQITKLYPKFNFIMMDRVKILTPEPTLKNICYIDIGPKYNHSRRKYYLGNNLFCKRLATDYNRVNFPVQKPSR